MKQDHIHKYNLKELTEILIKHDNIHEGLYNLGLEIKVGFGGMGVDQERFPGAMFGVSGVSLTITPPENKDPFTVDASKINPPTKKSSKK